MRAGFVRAAAAAIAEAQSLKERESVERAQRNEQWLAQTRTQRQLAARLER